MVPQSIPSRLGILKYIILICQSWPQKLIKVDFTSWQWKWEISVSNIWRRNQSWNVLYLFNLAPYNFVISKSPWEFLIMTFKKTILYKTSQRMFSMDGSNVLIHVRRTSRKLRYKGNHFFKYLLTKLNEKTLNTYLKYFST
jgi:hypothetical protein